MFNPKFTFESFVVGSSNNFACAAAKAVAEAPGKSYNPLFIYGGVGFGKTHLLHAIGQHVSSHQKGVRVACLSAEKFAGEFIDAIQNNQPAKFREKYLQTDVLLIDDIQFLAGKERIQEEFFHIFNALHEAHKQIVMTCDCAPGEIHGLEHRLVSRFEWGLVTDLQPPDVEMGLAILHKKAQLMGVQLPDYILLFLADRVRTDIRRLGSALFHVELYALLLRKGLLPLEAGEDFSREFLHEK
jgi:chromosomal replication initiator protein